MVEREGFEPSKSKTAELQSDGFDRSPTSPTRFLHFGLLVRKSPLASQENGAGTKNRTRDLLITSQLLYQLSYTGTAKVGGILAIFLVSASIYLVFFSFLDIQALKCLFFKHIACFQYTTGDIFNF